VLHQYEFLIWEIVAVTTQFLKTLAENLNRASSKRKNSTLDLNNFFAIVMEDLLNSSTVDLLSVEIKVFPT
jgi:hypothetical protein